MSVTHPTPARPIPPRAAARVPVQLQTAILDKVAAGADSMRALSDALPEQAGTLGRAVDKLVADGLLHRDGARLSRPGADTPAEPQPTPREPPRPVRPAPTPTPTPTPEPVSRLTGAELARRRAARGWSQADLARRLAPLIGAARGTAATYLSQLERGAWRLDDDTERARTWRPLLEQLLDPSAETDGAPREAVSPAEDLEPAAGPAEVATDPGEPIPPDPSALASTPPDLVVPEVLAEVDAPASQPAQLAPCTEEEADARVPGSAERAPGEADPSDGDRAGGRSGSAGPGGLDAGAVEPAAPVGPEPEAAPSSLDGEGLELGGRAVPDPVGLTLTQPAPAEWLRRLVEAAPARLDEADELAVLRVGLADALDQEGSDAWLVASVRELREERDAAVEEALHRGVELAAERSRREGLEQVIEAGLPPGLRRDLADASVIAKLGALIGLARGGW